MAQAVDRPTPSKDSILVASVAPGIDRHVGLRRLKRLRPGERLACFPAAMAASSLALVSGMLAFKALKAGCTDYWPQAQRHGLNPAGFNI